MQFYTNLRYAKSIIFFKSGLHLQRLFPHNFLHPVHVLARFSDIVVNNNYIGKCFCAHCKFCSEHFEWHLIRQSQSMAPGDSPLADSR